MRNQAFYKDLTRAISKSKARFLSILAMTALGVGFFAGINATKPDMVLSADTYFKDYQLANFRAISPLGFTPEDLETVKAEPDVLYMEAGYMKDAFLRFKESESAIIRLYSTSSEINLPLVTEGRLPQASGEILLEDSLRLYQDVQVGDKISLSLPEGEEVSESFTRTEYTVVGFLNSPLYITFERGQTNIGDGSVAYYGYIQPQDFALEKPNEIYVKTKLSDILTAYSERYKSYHEPTLNALEEIGKTAMARETEALKQELEDGRATLLENRTKAEEELADGEKKLRDAEAEILSGEKTLKDNEIKYTKEFADQEKKLEEGKRALAEGKAAYADGYAQWADGVKQVEAGFAELTLKKQELDAAGVQLAAAEAELSAARQELDQAIVSIAQLEGALEGLQVLRESLPATSTMTVEAYQAFLAGLRQILPELADTLEQTVTPETPGSTDILRGALDSVLGDLEAQHLEAKAQLQAGEESYAAGLAQVEANRTLYTQGLQAYEAGKLTLEASKAQLEATDATLKASAKTLAENEEKLLSGEKTLKEAKAEFQESLFQGWEDLAQARKDLEEGKATFAQEKADALAKLDEADLEIKDAERQLLELPAEWFVFDREGFPGYASLGTDADRLGAVAKIFPLFFFLVAALVCLTTMTRMVEEDRVQIGTLKALGYKTGTIASKYLTYSLLASLSGSVIGFLVGFQLFPRAIITVYGAMYDTPYVMAPFHGDLALLSTGIAVLTTMSASLFATLSELRETPANLMQPKAPKPGKRILLERITPLWKRLSFSYKVTFRNIFRYKKRFLMTVIGISGCTALLVTGFGIRDSVNAIMGKQFDEIFLYDGLVVLKDEGEKAPDLETILGQNDYIADYSAMLSETVTVYKEGQRREFAVNLMVPESTPDFEHFFTLRDRVSQKKLELPASGAVISEKLAKLLQVQVGSTILYRDPENHTYRLQVAGIAENYLSHYIFMDREAYDEVTRKSPTMNTGIFTLKNPETTPESELNESLLAHEEVQGTFLVESMREDFGKSLSSLDYVILILILAAGALAFVVLYNLTNINITERIREIATIKVLGFRDPEVSSYVYRENFFLTLIGTLLGLVLGLTMHQFVMNTMEVDNMMFGRKISLLSYGLSIALTLFFSFIVNLFMSSKLKKIDMVESLKSVE